MHCQGSTQSPLTQPGKVTHWSHRGPCQPDWHLRELGKKGADVCGGAGMEKGLRLLSVEPRALAGLCPVPGRWVPGNQYQSPEWKSLKRRSAGEQAEGSPRARGRAAFCRSGLQWSHLQEALPPPTPLRTPSCPRHRSQHPPPPGPLVPLTSPHTSLVSCGGEEAVCCSPGAKPSPFFLPDVMTPQNSALALQHAASGEPLHYLQTLSSSQNPFWGWQAGKHSAPEAQERLHHSPHEALQAVAEATTASQEAASDPLWLSPLGTR